MAMKNSALKVIFESTSSTDILKRRSIRIKMAQFIEDIDVTTDLISTFTMINESKIISCTFYTADLLALDRIIHNGVTLELLLGQYDTVSEFDRWLSNYDKTAFTNVLQRVTTQIISEIKALAQAAQDIHNNEDISDEALCPIIVRMEDYIKVIDILADKYKSYYAGNIWRDYAEMIRVKIAYAKKYSKENWPILFRR